MPNDVANRFYGPSAKDSSSAAEEFTNPKNLKPCNTDLGPVGSTTMHKEEKGELNKGDSFVIVSDSVRPNPSPSLSNAGNIVHRCSKGTHPCTPNETDMLNPSAVNKNKGTSTSITSGGTSNITPNAESTSAISWDVESTSAIKMESTSAIRLESTSAIRSNAGSTSFFSKTKSSVVPIGCSAKLDLGLRIGKGLDASKSNFAEVNVGAKLGNINIDYQQSFGGLPKHTLGVSIPLKISTEPDKATLGLSMVVTPVVQLMRGSLKVDRWWNNPILGLPLQMGNIILGMECDVKLIPTGFNIGGAVCLGKTEQRKTKTQPFITYIRVSATSLADNYIIVVIPEVTIGGIVNTVTGYFPALKDVGALTPKKLAESGIRVSFSISFVKQKLAFESSDVVIPVGAILQGDVNLLGWKTSPDLGVSETWVCAFMKGAQAFAYAGFVSLLPRKKKKRFHGVWKYRV